MFNLLNNVDLFQILMNVLLQLPMLVTKFVLMYLVPMIVIVTLVTGWMTIFSAQVSIIPSYSYSITFIIFLFLYLRYL